MVDHHAWSGAKYFSESPAMRHAPLAQWSSQECFDINHFVKPVRLCGRSSGAMQKFLRKSGRRPCADLPRRRPITAGLPAAYCILFHAYRPPFSGTMTSFCGNCLSPPQYQCLFLLSVLFGCLRVLFPVGRLCTTVRFELSLAFLNTCIFLCIAGNNKECLIVQWVSGIRTLFYWGRECLPFVVTPCTWFLGWAFGFPPCPVALCWLVCGWLALLLFQFWSVAGGWLPVRIAKIRRRRGFLLR